MAREIEQTGLKDRLFALLLQLLPHHLLSQLMYWLTHSEWPPLKGVLIRAFIRIYRVDTSSALEPDPARYPSFNAFFTRALKPEARPTTADTRAVSCPVDGTVSQAQTIRNGSIIQAKGIHYSLDELLGGEQRWVDVFRDGSFVTLYLSPRDYHRVHMPLPGRLERMIHIPGRLFSVSPSSTRTIPRIFSRNERVVNLFETEAGPMAVIMVGAIFVAGIDTVWAGTVTPRSRSIGRWDYGAGPAAPVELKKGAELGRFNMGSTVILLFARDAVTWDHTLQPGSEVWMGEEIGTLESE